MATNDEKMTRYAELGQRIAAAKRMAANRKNGLLPEPPPKKAKRKNKNDGKTVVGPEKLTKEQKDPTLTQPESKVDENLRAMLGDKTKDDRTGLNMFQVALVEKIEEMGELSVLDLCYMIWDKEEIAQAKKSPVGKKPADLTRIVRNAIRAPKNAGIIAPSGEPGKYIFLKWKRAGRS